MTTGIVSALGSGPIRSKNRIGPFNVSNYTFGGTRTVRFSQTNTQTTANIGVSIEPKGGGAFSLQAPDGLTSGGNARGLYSVDLQLLRTAASQVVSGKYGFSAGSNNTISNDYGVAIGFTNIVSGMWGVAIGNTCTASNNNALALGGFASATRPQSTSISRSIANRTGELCHGGAPFVSYGDFQHGWIPMSQQSTSTTPVILYLDTSTPSDLPILAAGTRWKCTAEIMATTTGAINNSASWEYKFQIDRPTTAASTIIRSTPLLTLSDGSNSGAPPAGWSVAITADTTNGCIQIQVTGDTNPIYWTCILRYVQLIRA